MSQASCILIWCYRSDGGGSGDGHCGCHMCIPVKKKLVELKNKKQKRLTKRLETCCLKPLALLGATVVMVVSDGLVASVVVVHVAL